MTTADIEREKALKSREQKVEQPKYEPKGAEEYLNMVDTEAEKPSFKPSTITPLKDNRSQYDLAKASGVTLPQKTETTTVADPITQTQEERFDLDKDKGLGGSMPDVMTDVNEQGKVANQAIQNAEMPRYKPMTIRDIVSNPEYEGIRDYLIADRVSSALSQGMGRLGGVDLGIESQADKYNDEQLEAYSERVADRDKRALNAQLDALEAGNAQQVALETSLADTIANTYIQRYKSEQDAITKRKVLEQMLADSDTLFGGLLGGENGDEKVLNLATLMGLYSGDFSITTDLIRKYAPSLMASAEQFIADITGKPFGNAQPRNNNTGVTDYNSKTIATIDGVNYTSETLDNMLGADPVSLNRAIATLPLEQQRNVIAQLDAGWNSKDVFKRKEKIINSLWASYDTRAFEEENKDILLAEKEKKSKERVATYKTKVTDALGKPSYDKRIANLETLVDSFDTEKGQGFIDPTQEEVDYIDEVRNLIEKTKQGREAKAFDSFASANVKDQNIDNYSKFANDKNSILNTLTSLSNRTEGTPNLKLKINEILADSGKADTDQIEMARQTDGYKKILNYLSSPTTRAYIQNNPNFNELYKSATKAFTDTFGGKEEDYGFYIPQ